MTNEIKIEFKPDSFILTSMLWAAVVEMLIVFFILATQNLQEPAAKKGILLFATIAIGCTSYYLYHKVSLSLGSEHINWQRNLLFIRSKILLKYTDIDSVVGPDSNLQIKIKLKSGNTLKISQYLKLQGGEGLLEGVGLSRMENEMKFLKVKILEKMNENSQKGNQ